MLEYALLAVLIALVAIIGVARVGTATRTTFHTASNAIAGMEADPGPFN